MPKHTKKEKKKSNSTVFGFGKRNTDDVGTPDSLLTAIAEEFGTLVDPCPIGGKAKAQKNPKMDGLRINWKTSDDHWVFCNPPYTNVQPWIRKAVLENKASGVKSMLLIPARVWNAFWFDHIYTNVTEIRIFRRPLIFKGYDKIAPFGSALVIFGGKRRKRYTSGSMGQHEYVVL
jgi:hypothetical protein